MLSFSSGFIAFYHVLYILFKEVFPGIRTSVHNNSSLEWEISGRPASSSCCRCQAIWLPSLGQDTSRELAGASPQQESLGRGKEGRGECEDVWKKNIADYCHGKLVSVTGFMYMFMYIDRKTCVLRDITSSKDYSGLKIILGNLSRKDI